MSGGHLSGGFCPVLVVYNCNQVIRNVARLKPIKDILGISFVGLTWEIFNLTCSIF